MIKPKVTVCEPFSVEQEGMSEMRQMKVIDVVRKLCGRIDPIGRSEVDINRLDNLEEFGEVALSAVRDLRDVIDQNRMSREDSVKRIVTRAHFYLDEIQEYLE